MPLIKNYADCVKKNVFFAVVLCVSYAGGMILGIVLPKNMQFFYLSDSVVNYYVDCLTGYGSFAGSCFGCFFTDLCVYALFFGLSFSVFLFPLQGVFVFYGGYILGCVAVSLIVNFTVGGFMLFVFTVLVHSVLSTAGLIVFSCVSIEMSKKKCKNALEKKVKNACVCFLFSLAGLLARILILTLVLRPMNVRF